jgi:glycosyltransferase involved in cell wall biosynthesis
MISQSGHNDPRVRRQAESLAQNGYEVDIICVAINSDEPKVEKFGAITFYRILHKRRPEGIILSSLHYIQFFVLAFLKLQLLHFQRRYKLIQIHNMPEFHVFTTIFQKMSGVPIVLDLHDLTPELFECKWGDGKRSSITSIIRVVEKLSCKFADRLITVNDICKENLTHRGVPADKITLVLNTPNQKIFKFDDHREFNTITSGAKLIYHGTVAERFGIHTAIEAMKYLNEKIPNSTFSIYGRFDVSYRKHLEKLISDLNLENCVSLNKEYPQEEIYQFIKGSDFGIVYYLDNEYMNLCLSTKMFEYNASLLPVVATRLKAFSMIFGDDCIAYTKSENPRDLADKIVELCFNPEKRKSMTAKAYSVLQGISGEIMSKRYVGLVESTINGKKELVS